MKLTKTKLKEIVREEVIALTEGDDFTDEQRDNIFNVLQEAIKISNKAVRKNNNLEDDINWLKGESGLPRFIRTTFSATEGYAIKGEVEGDNDELKATIIVKANAPSSIGSSPKGDIIYKVHMHYSSSLGETFYDERKMFRYLKREVENFHFQR